MGRCANLLEPGLNCTEIQVKCNQTGQVHKVGVSELSLEDGHAVSEKHLKG